MSPSIEAGKAKMTSFTSVDCTRATNDSTSVGRPHPIHGADDAAQDVVQPAVLSDRLQAKRSRMSSTTHNVELSGGVGANVAHPVFCGVVARGTRLDALAHRHHALGEVPDALFVA